MNLPNWQQFAQRIVHGINAQPGELIQISDHADRPEVLQAIALAVDLAGATPLIDYLPPRYLEQWLTAATPDLVTKSAQHRHRWIEQIDRAIVLSGYAPDLSLVSPAVLQAFEQMSDAITEVEELRLLPMIVAAVPTEPRAQQLGMTLAALENHLVPAHLLSIVEGQSLIKKALTNVAGDEIVIHTGEGQALHLQHGDRHWHGDDGLIDEVDRQRKTIVSNLPAGSIYTTVLEEQTEGTLFLPRAHKAQNVLLRFAQGRIVEIQAEQGGAELAAWLDSHSGEARRVSHIGIGLNPHLRQPIGWTLVDEHIAGAIFLALGENRYMGGQNVSSLNHDFSWFGASLAVDGRVVVEEGRLAFVWQNHLSNLN